MAIKIETSTVQANSEISRSPFAALKVAAKEIQASPAVVVKISEAAQSFMTQQTQSNPLLDAMEQAPSIALPDNIQAQFDDIKSRVNTLVDQQSPSFDLQTSFRNLYTISLGMDEDQESYNARMQDYATSFSKHLDLADSISPELLPSFVQFSVGSETLGTLGNLNQKDRDDFLKLASSVPEDGVSLGRLNKIINDMSPDSQHDFLRIAMQITPDITYTNGVNLTGARNINVLNLINSFNNSNDENALLGLLDKVNAENPEVSTKELLRQTTAKGNK